MLRNETQPILIDRDTGYQQHYTPPAIRLNSVEMFRQRSQGYSEHQRKVLAQEAALFGIDPSTQPEKFVAAHIDFVNDAAEYHNSLLADAKERVTQRTAEYFADGDTDVLNGLKALLGRRLEATNMAIMYDNLAYGYTVAASFDSLLRQVLLPTATVVEGITICVDEEAYRIQMRDVVMAHELLHGAATTATQEDGNHKYSLVRSGLMVKYRDQPDETNFDSYRHGGWLDEAALESFRREIFATNEVRYEPGVAVVEMIDGIAPGIRDRIVLGRLDTAGPAPLYGEVESILGPFAIEEISLLIDKVRAFKDYAQFRSDVLLLLPASLRKRAKALFDASIEGIYGCRNGYDEKIRALKNSE